MHKYTKVQFANIKFEILKLYLIFFPSFSESNIRWFSFCVNDHEIMISIPILIVSENQEKCVSTSVSFENYYSISQRKQQKFTEMLAQVSFSVYVVY